MEMTGRVKQKFSKDDNFWSTQFKCNRVEGDDSLDLDGE